MGGWIVVPFLDAANTTTAVRPQDSKCEECGLFVKGIAASAGVEEITEAKPHKGLRHGHGIKPSSKEVEDHERTHLPFRSWCARCVRGKAQSHPHWNKSKEGHGIPTISWDYFYMDDNENDKADPEGEEGGDETPIVA